MSHLSISHSLLWCYINNLWLRAPGAEQGAPKSLGVFWVTWHRNFGNSITAWLWKDHSCIQGLGKQKQTSREWDGERLILSSREAFTFENQQHCKLGHRSVCVQALGSASCPCAFVSGVVSAQQWQCSCGQDRIHSTAALLKELQMNTYLNLFCFTLLWFLYLLKCIL